MKNKPQTRTPGQLHVVEQPDLDHAGNGYRYALKVRSTKSYAQNPAYANSAANAERLARCWNSHEALLAALRTMLSLHEGQEHLYGLTKSGKAVYRRADKAACAAIAKATGGAP